jgi:hypothetical protein
LLKILTCIPLPNGKNNQDASYYTASDAAIVAVVCDGCGSCQNSEVGAKLGAKLVVNTLNQMLSCLPERSLNSDQLPGQSLAQKPTQKLVQPSNNIFWQLFKQNLAEQLGRVAIALAGFCPEPDQKFADQPHAHAPELKQVITDYLLFTLVGALITPETTTIFSIGDGLACLNEQTIRIGPFPGNAPPYIAYALLNSAQGNTLPSDLVVHIQQPTASVNSILLGTDGVCDLITLEKHKLPGKYELVGKLSQFWQSDRYFHNPDLIRRRLWLANQEGIKPDWQTRRLDKSPGLLPDDTTLIAIRRINNSFASEDSDMTIIQVAEGKQAKRGKD